MKKKNKVEINQLLGSTHFKSSIGIYLRIGPFTCIFNGEKQLPGKPKNQSRFGTIRTHSLLTNGSGPLESAKTKILPYSTYRLLHVSYVVTFPSELKFVFVFYPFWLIIYIY